MVSTHLKNISQIGNLPQIGGENKKYLKPPPSFYPTRIGSSRWCWMLPKLSYFLNLALLQFQQKNMCQVIQSPAVTFFYPNGSRSPTTLSKGSRFRHPEKVTKNCQVCFFLLVRSFPQVVSWYLPSCLQLGKTALVCRA